MVRLTPLQVETTVSTIPEEERSEIDIRSRELDPNGLWPEERLEANRQQDLADKEEDRQRTRDENLEFADYQYDESPWGDQRITRKEGNEPIWVGTSFLDPVNPDSGMFGSDRGRMRRNIFDRWGDFIAGLYRDPDLTGWFQSHGIAAGWFSSDDIQSGVFDARTRGFVEDVRGMARAGGISIQEQLSRLRSDAASGGGRGGGGGRGASQLNADDLKDLVKAVAGQELGRTNLTDAELDAFVAMARAGAAVGRNPQNAASEYLTNIAGAEKQATDVAGMVNAFRRMALGGQ